MALSKKQLFIMNMLEKLTRLEKEAADFGFKWEKPDQIMTQIRSECSEVEVHIQDKDPIKLQEEIGDLLHAVFSLCVFCGFNPQTTLEKSVNKFEQRFKAVQQLAHEQGFTTLENQPFDALMALWEKAKKKTFQET